MNEDIKQRWLIALRSKKYKQANGVLRKDENHFCCLGVLCDVVDPSEWSPGDGDIADFFYGGSHRYLPDRLSRNIRLSRDVINKAMEMNDNGKRFAKIADYLEKNA